MFYSFGFSISAWRQRIHSRFLLLATALLLCFLVPAAQAGNADSFRQIDEDMQIRVDAFYREWLKEAAPSERAAQVNLSTREPEPALRAALWIRANLESLEESLEKDSEPRLQEALALLYHLNDTASIRKLTDQLNRSGSAAAQAHNYLLLARYYHARQNWQGVMAALKKVKPGDLPAQDSAYAALLQGYALQAEKKHREATDFYRQIPPTSSYYPYAKLNEGTAYLRQGWWSEAFAEFEQGIKALPEDSELKNRLLATLGHAQIHHEFYRNARETLRKVSLTSQYTPKALMGLGLAAAHQQDLRSALNLFSRLVASTSIDINVDEAHLLVPHVYEQLNEKKNAAEAYQRAVDFYQRRLVQLDRAEQSLRNSARSLPQILPSLSLRADELYGAADPIPEHMHSAYEQLLAMERIARSSGLKVSFADLQRQFEQTFESMLVDSMLHRREMLESYLSQAKFGLATLYDNP